MTRISAEAVKHAYDETGLLPCRNRTVNTIGCNTFGCALAALYAEQAGRTPTEDDVDDIFAWAGQEFGSSYASNFMAGFDSLKLVGPPAYPTANEDGRKAAAAVFGGAS